MKQFIAHTFACLILVGFLGCTPGPVPTPAGPTANAGSNQTVNSGEVVTLDAGSSEGAVSYSWAQVSGPEVTIINPLQAQATFVASQDGAYIFRVSVRDASGLSDTDTVSVTVGTGGNGNANDNQNNNDNTPDNQNDNGNTNDNGNANDNGNTNDNQDNTPPVADAGEDISVSLGAFVELDANGSEDADGDEISFEWRQVAGEDISLENADNAIAGFTATMAGSFSFEVIVTDEFGESDTDTVDVEVNNSGQEPELTTLTTIDFSGDVPAGLDPATYSIGGGTIRLSSGSARMAQPAESSLTAGFSDNFAWFASSGSTATITFSGMDVRKFQVYFADLGAPGAEMIVESSFGSEIDTIDSHTAALSGDTAAFFTVDGGNATISRIQIIAPTGTTVAIDSLTLTVAN